MQRNECRSNLDKCDHWLTAALKKRRRRTIFDESSLRIPLDSGYVVIYMSVIEQLSMFRQ
jgi:hypothetical protein